MKIRQEDLLQRFLMGLSDHDSRVHVELYKEPNTIEEAVQEVITFTEAISPQEDHTVSKFKKQVRQVKGKQKTYSKKGKDKGKKQDDQSLSEDSDQPNPPKPGFTTVDIEQIKDIIKRVNQEQRRDENIQKPNGYQGNSHFSSSPNYVPDSNSYNRRENINTANPPSQQGYVADIEDEALLGLDVLMKADCGPANLRLSDGIMLLGDTSIPCQQIGLPEREPDIFVSCEDKAEKNNFSVVGRIKLGDHEPVKWKPTLELSEHFKERDCRWWEKWYCFLIIYRIYFRSQLKNVQPKNADIICNLLNKFSNAFSKNDMDLGLTNLTENCIDTGDATPVKHPPRRVP
ncbi:unnamed protein product [Mytilus edulis]|uniref:Uncharacterized protein n=1 Tax=Mytilus edulis TaxID=6550 RepID=A0A8S3V0C9_MYTED|nr:unnamed protein product [Mytilus edulis]